MIKRINIILMVQCNSVTCSCTNNIFSLVRVHIHDVISVPYYSSYFTRPEFDDNFDRCLLLAIEGNESVHFLLEF